MEGIIFLVIAAFLFAVIGVIALLARTSAQAELLREYGKRIALLEDSINFFVSSRVGGHTPEAESGQYPDSSSGEKVTAGEAPPTEPPVMEAPAGEPAFTVADKPASWEPAPAADNPVPGEPVTAADITRLEEVFPVSEPEGPEITAARAETFFPPETEAPPAGSSPARKNPLAAFIRGGNLWAVGGIILLFAAFTMLITYLARRGFFTVEMGISGAAVSGLAMLAAGWRFRKKRPVYFLLLQGGGIGILYLSVFAAHKLTPYFPPLVSLILMSLLLPPALILALFQGSQALALLGFLGGFAAPLLLASGEGNHVFLFAYFGVLDLGVLGISLFRRWKGLNLLAFLCTFILANYWAAVYYEPALFGGAEPFFLAYILIFTILGVRGFGTEETRGETNVDLALILGTPMAGAVLQWKIFDSVPHGHALICLIFSAFYIVLAFLMWKRRGGELRIFSEGYIGLGMLLANLAIPLELAPRITSAAWAAEGAVVFFFGRRLKNFKTAAAGLILHLAAAVAFAAEQDVFAYGEGAFRGTRFTGSLVIALSALVMVFITERSPRLSPAPENHARRAVFPIALGIWAFIWWFGGWSYEIFRVFDDVIQLRPLRLERPGAVLFLFYSVSALAAFAGSKFLRSPVCRIGMIPSLAAGLFLTLATFVSWVPDYLTYRPWMILSHNFFEGLFLWGWLTFFAVQALLLFFSRKGLPEKIHGIWLLIVVFITLGVTSSSGRALTLSREFAPAWISLAGMAPVFVIMIGVSFFARRMRTEPAAGADFHKKLFLFVLPLILSCIMGLWFFVTLFFSGDPAPLPFYIPIINPLDLEEAFCAVLFLLWQVALLHRKDLPAAGKPALLVIIDTAVFLFTIALTARSVHFYGHIPYSRIFDADVFHLCLFILWAVYGIGHIIGGFKLSLRKVWIAGAVLTVADIAKLLILDLAGTGAITRIVSFFIAGLLLLFIGWAAPLPPPEGKQTIPPDSGEKSDV